MRRVPPVEVPDLVLHNIACLESSLRWATCRHVHTWLARSEECQNAARNEESQLNKILFHVGCEGISTPKTKRGNPFISSVQAEPTHFFSPHFHTMQNHHVEITTTLHIHIQASLQLDIPMSTTTYAKRSCGRLLTRSSTAPGLPKRPTITAPPTPQADTMLCFRRASISQIVRILRTLATALVAKVSGAPGVRSPRVVPLFP